MSITNKIKIKMRRKDYISFVLDGKHYLFYLEKGNAPTYRIDKKKLLDNLAFLNDHEAEIYDFYENGSHLDEDFMQELKAYREKYNHNLPTFKEPGQPNIDIIVSKSVLCKDFIDYCKPYQLPRRSRKTDLYNLYSLPYHYIKTIRKQGINSFNIDINQGKVVVDFGKSKAKFINESATMLINFVTDSIKE